jgi:predicted RNA binding protein YcfA (HicA-like mRNA interferase family)
MKLPRDLSGNELAKKLSIFGYRITRQTGSHLLDQRKIVITQRKENRGDAKDV